MAPSRSLTTAVREIVQMVRPELNDDQVRAAARVIAWDVQPKVLSNDPDDVRRGRQEVRKAIESVDRYEAGYAEAADDEQPELEAGTNDGEASV